MNTETIFFDSLQFYADKKNQYENKLFTFKVNSSNAAFGLLYKFALSGNHFRSAWLNTRYCDKNNIFTLCYFSYKNPVDFFNQLECTSIPTLKETMKYYNEWFEVNNRTEATRQSSQFHKQKR